MFLIYILYSEDFDKFYIGHTNNIDRRLQEHNSDEFNHYYTSKYKPWKMKMAYQTGESKALAMKLEKFIKILFQLWLF